MLTCLHQTYHRSLLKGTRLLILFLALIIIWRLNSIEVAAAPPDLTRERIEATAPGIDPRQLEVTPVVSQAITSTLASQATAAICPPPVEVTPDLNQSLFVNGLFSLTQAVLPDAEFTEPVNLLLLGSDSRPGEKYGHTDAMLLATIDPVSQTAGLLSVPRDLWVSIPGYGEARINQAYRLGQLKGHPGGGAALVRETVEANFGVSIDFYALMSFEGFSQIIDTLGGIEMCITETIDAAAYYGYKAEYIDKEDHFSFVPLSAVPVPPAENNEASALPADPADPNRGYQFLYIEPGLQTLDGDTALSYARSRASVTADFARIQRQQAVLMAIKKKALQLNIIPIIPELWQHLGGLVETDLTMSQIVYLAHLAQMIPAANIQTGAIGHQETVDYRTSSGARVLLPKRAAIEAVVEATFGPVEPTAPLTRAEIESGLNLDLLAQEPAAVSQQ
jgi:LCP family protein required for cell wall assembly